MDVRRMTMKSLVLVLMVFSSLGVFSLHMMRADEMHACPFKSMMATTTCHDDGIAGVVAHLDVMDAVTMATMADISVLAAIALPLFAVIITISNLSLPVVGQFASPFSLPYALRSPIRMRHRAAALHNKRDIALFSVRV